VKVLVLDEEFPFPPNNGKRTRSFNLYRRLAERFQIRYLAYGTAGSAAADAVKAAGMEPEAVPVQLPAKQGPLFYLRLAANLLSPLPYIVTSHSSAAYRLKVRSSLAQFRPEVVLCEWTPYVIYAKELTSVRTLVTAHNVEADIWRRYYEHETNPLRRCYVREQWRKVDRFERSAMGWVDGAFAVSKLDRERLLGYRPSLPIAVVENGVDLDYFRASAQPDARRHVVFTGSMDWRPNQDAARYFVSEILPSLRRVEPKVECTFVGRNPPPEILALASVPGVHITGTVEDVRPFVARAAVYVVPLRIGGGSRLKVLEALAMGRAVVSTSVGAEGLDVEHGRDILVADTPEAFAESVLNLLGNPSRCAVLAQAGRRLVERRYGWDALAGKMGDVIRATCEGRSPAAERALMNAQSAG